jgi:type IV pilus assembly protein PilM
LFGRVKCYAGIDIGTETIKVAVVALRRDVAQVVKVAILPTPEGVVQDGAVVQPGQVAAVIKEALAQGDRLRVDGAVPLVPGNQLTVRTLSLPPMSPVELKEAARWEAGQYLPFPAEEASFDIVETSKGADVVEALFVGCREAVVDGLVAAVEAAGLRCLAVEAAPVVLPRLSGTPSRPASSAIGAVEAAASGERRAIAYRVERVSTSRTRARPVSLSSRAANGIGTKLPPCIEIMAAFPPASRYLAAQ